MAAKTIISVTRKKCLIFCVPQSIDRFFSVTQVMLLEIPFTKAGKSIRLFSQREPFNLLLQLFSFFGGVNKKPSLNLRSLKLRKKAVKRESRKLSEAFSPSFQAQDTLTRTFDTAVIQRLFIREQHNISCVNISVRKRQSHLLLLRRRLVLQSKEQIDGKRNNYKGCCIYIARWPLIIALPFFKAAPTRK